MRAIVIAFIFLVFSSVLSFSKDNENFINYSKSANVLPKGDFRYSLFGQTEVGLSNKLTISAHPIMLFVSPSIDLKYNFMKNEKYSISTIHGATCPTLLLNLVKTKGTGGFISPEFEIPFMLSIRNGIIGTYKYAPNHILSGSFVFEFALFNSSLDPGTSIDIPLISPRSAVYYRNAGFDLALSAEGKICNKFDYAGKAELFLFPFSNERYNSEYDKTTNSLFSEFSGMIFWNINKSIKLGAGARLCYGYYPYGEQWHLLPLLDFVKYVGK
ncbi:MAG: hypothetical protein WCR42_11440 [bacterium]